MFIEGVGYHAETVGEEGIVKIRRWLTITEIIYVWNLCWTKLSLLFMYYRIFHFPFFKKLTIGVGCFVVTWAVCISFLFSFICSPVEKLWRPPIPGHCVSELGVWLANASSTIFSDVVILLLPIPQIWRLQLKKFEKIGLTLVFGLGFFAVFASSFRTWVLFNYSKHDIPYTLTPLLVWSQIEMSAGIISACLPTMRPIVRLASSKLGLTKIFNFSRFSQSASKTGQGPSSSSSSRDAKLSKLSNRSDSRGADADMALPSFVTPQTLRVTAESTRRSDRDSSAFYRLPDGNESSDVDVDGRGRGRMGGILVETSLEWGLESEGNTGSEAGAGAAQETTTTTTDRKWMGTSYDETSSVEMDAGSATTSWSDIPMKRIWKKG
ncbi:hypothetical protein QQS21_005256 [Conoideocrella luteorostrata]|uniref:Rhodopsin domain-containing protein n=1 Tax=Conoideocrella luteorostrata TaxID=1105319 RepID=A0AAJ0CPU7_9HYPO|nr:hypothetical protein QQS21_005256 [Conoideocrella luteorostrata]